MLIFQWIKGLLIMHSQRSVIELHKISIENFKIGSVLKTIKYIHN